MRAGYRKPIAYASAAALAVVTFALITYGQSQNDVPLSMSTLCRLSHAKSRAINAENFTGEKGKGGMATEGERAAAARDLGPGWKISPGIIVKPGETFTLADIAGPGLIQHLWMTTTGPLRFYIVRLYWDDEKSPSVEVPLGDFFASAYGQYSQVSSVAVDVNPRAGYNSYWQMPFRKHCRITIQDLDDAPLHMAYQVDYALDQIPADAAYFHAQFRRENPVAYKQPYTILDGVKGWGQYVGTYFAWGVHNNGWWGEGEIKFYIDGDEKFPTICGTGTEDYITGSHDFDVGSGQAMHYQEFTTLYAGLPQIIRPDGHYQAQMRFGMYRWHILDPIRFEKDLRVTIQDLGWRSGKRFLPLQDDISSVAYWYQTEPHVPFPKLPAKDELEIN